jgi:hypothetical protein
MFKRYTTRVKSNYKRMAKKKKLTPPGNYGYSELKAPKTVVV